MTDTIDFHDKYSAEFSFKYEKKKDFKERYEAWAALIDEYSKDARTALDVGCGSGVFSFYCAKKGIRTTGFDPAPNMIDLCEKKKHEGNLKNLEFQIGSIDALSEKNAESADLIICSSVLEYISDINVALKIFRRLLTKEGTLLVSLPNRASFYRKFEKLAYFAVGRPRYYKMVKNVLTITEFEKICESAEFRLSEYRYYAYGPLRALKFFLPSRYCGNLFVAALKK